MILLSVIGKSFVSLNYGCNGLYKKEKYIAFPENRIIEVAILKIKNKKTVLRICKTVLMFFKSLSNLISEQLSDLIEESFNQSQILCDNLCTASKLFIECKCLVVARF